MDCTQYIRCFDLGGGGLKTALVKFDGRKMHIKGDVKSLGKCPDDQHVDEWVRNKLKEIHVDLDKEVKEGFKFGFSLAGLDKLRSKPVSKHHMHDLFKLPSDKVAATDDGKAHLIASLHTVKNLPQGRVWNIALGTGVGFGFTNSLKEPKPTEDLKKFFECAAWEAKEPKTGKGIWEAGSGPAFDKIRSNCGSSDKAMDEFSSRWSAFIDKQIIERSKDGKDWGKPSAIVFTGGHTEHHSGKLVKSLAEKNTKVSVYQGPAQAGILGAAWNVIDSRK